MKAVRLLDAAAGRRRDARRGDGPDLRDRRDGPGRRSPSSSRRTASRSATTGRSRAAASSPSRPGADGTTTIVRWDETLDRRRSFPHLGAIGDDAGPRPIFQADLERLQASSSRRVPSATEPPHRAAPPRRRDLRAVPGALRAAAAGPRARRHPAVGRVRAVRPAPVPAARAGRDPRRLRHGPGHRVVPQRPVPGLQVVGRDAARAARPVPDRRGRRRGARHRPVADGRVRGRRRDRRGGRPLRRRRSGRADRRLHARQGHGPARPSTSGSCSGTAAAASPTTTPASARSGAWRRPRSRTGSALVGDSSDGYPGLPGWGAKSARRGPGPLRPPRGRSRPRRPPGRSRASAARGR